jgi:hypothetical protein
LFPPALLFHESTEHHTPQYIFDAVEIFPSARIRFVGPLGNESRPTFSLALFYVGDRPERFEEAFTGIGEVGMAAVLAGSIAVPAGIWFAGQTETSLAFIGAAVLFLPLFVFLPKLIQHGMKADTEATIDAFGKNKQVKKVFWTLFVAMAGLVMTRVVDPVTAQKIVGLITGFVV